MTKSKTGITNKPDKKVVDKNPEETFYSGLESDEGKIVYSISLYTGDGKVANSQGTLDLGNIFSKHAIGAAEGEIETLVKGSVYSRFMRNTAFFINEKTKQYREEAEESFDGFESLDGPTLDGFESHHADPLDE